MTRTETSRILALLAHWYPNASQIKGDTKAVVEAWYLVLGAYDYDDVKLRAVAWNTGPKGRYCPDARELIPEQARIARPQERQYTGEELRQAWRQNCWAWAHTGLVPDGWEPSEFLLSEMAQYAPGTA